MLWSYCFCIVAGYEIIVEHSHSCNIDNVFFSFNSFILHAKAELCSLAGGVHVYAT